VEQKKFGDQQTVADMMQLVREIQIGIDVDDVMTERVRRLVQPDAVLGHLSP
jgi:hypothetical protein